MFKIIEGLPQDVLAIEASGKGHARRLSQHAYAQGRSDDRQGSDQNASCHREGFRGLELGALWKTVHSGSDAGTISATSPW